MKNTLWIGDDQIDLGEPTATVDDGQYVIETTLSDGRNVSVCFSPETWDFLVDAVANLSISDGMLGLEEIDFDD